MTACIRPTRTSFFHYFHFPLHPFVVHHFLSTTFTYLSLQNFINLENMAGRISNKYGDMRDYRAPTLFQPHRAQQAIADAHAGKIPRLIGYYIGLPSPPIAKMAAQFGYDIVWIDCERIVDLLTKS
jgi:hypothetical protein